MSRDPRKVNDEALIRAALRGPNRAVLLALADVATQGRVHVQAPVDIDRQGKA